MVEARRLLDAARDGISATRDAAAGKLGLVRLGYVGSAMYGRLPTYLRHFRQCNPHVRIDLREMTTVAQAVALRERKIDLAILIPPLGRMDGLLVEPFSTDRLAIALPASHRFAVSEQVSLNEFKHEPFVIWPRDQGPGFYDRVTRLCGSAGFAPRIVQEAHGMHGVLALVAVEIGIAIVPASMATVRADEIVYFPLSDEAAEFQLVACCRAEDDSPAVTPLFRALIR